MNFHLGETPPRELWEREQIEPAARLLINITKAVGWAKARRLALAISR
jgi:hypothetical protein